MKARSPVLLKLAELYENSAGGRHGAGKLDFQPDYEALLHSAGCAEGEARELAERELRALDGRILELEYDHPRARTTILKVRLSPANEERFYGHIGRQSPTARRAEWAAFFREAVEWTVPDRFAESWRAFCARRAEGAVNWRGMAPFKREDLAAGRETLEVLRRVLCWEGRHLVRWASSIICGNSKTLERRQGTLEGLLADATADVAPTFESLGILPVPSGVTFHGPIRLRIGAEWRDYRGLAGESKVSGADIERITEIECESQRCLTVENATPFRSLVAMNAGELLIFTSYPNEATLGLLLRLGALAAPPEFWHFGDTDPSGFHILHDLRERSGLGVRGFQMKYRSSATAPSLKERERALVDELVLKMPGERQALEAMLAAGNKGDFEQESLKPPTLEKWPFYPGEDALVPEV